MSTNPNQSAAHEAYESLIETLDILSDPHTMEALAEAEQDLASGNLFNLD